MAREYGYGIPRGPDVVLYVATSGNDANPGTVGSPFATIDGARAYIRAHALNTSTTSDVTVNVGPGDYWATGVTFTNADAGSLFCKVKYRAQNGINTVRLLGGTQVTGWSLYSGSIYRAAVSGDFWTLYENGVRATLARIPDLVANASYPEAQEPNYTAANTHGNGSYTTFEYSTSDIDPSTWQINDVRLNQRVGGVEWWNDIDQVSGYDAVNHFLNLPTHPKYGFASLGGLPRYFIEGDLSFLTQAGEWYYDRNDNHGSPGGGLHYLYYWPRSTPIASQEIVIPTTRDVVSFVGADSAHPVTDIELRDLTIQYSDHGQFFRYGDWGTGNPGDYDPNIGAGHDPLTKFYGIEQTETPHRHGAVLMSNALRCSVVRSKISCAGYNGVMMFGYNHSNQVTDSLIERCGVNGINIEGNWPGEGDDGSGNIVRNCKIRHIGEIALQGAGIWLTNASGNWIRNVEIYGGRRDGIFITVGGAAAGNTTWTLAAYGLNNLIEYAYLHDLCQDSGDCGALGIYAVGNTQNTEPPAWRRNTFRQIIINNIAAHPSMVDIAPVCVFTDNQSYGQVFENVQLTPSGSIRIATDSGSHSTTNVSWVAGFNSALIDTANIGVTALFPY